MTWRTGIRPGSCCEWTGSRSNRRRASEMRCQHLQLTLLICNSFVLSCLFHSAEHDVVSSVSAAGLTCCITHDIKFSHYDIHALSPAFPCILNCHEYPTSAENLNDSVLSRCILTLLLENHGQSPPIITPDMTPPPPETNLTLTPTPPKSNPESWP